LVITDNQRLSQQNTKLVTRDLSGDWSERAQRKRKREERKAVVGESYNDILELRVHTKGKETQSWGSVLRRWVTGLKEGSRGGEKNANKALSEEKTDKGATRTARRHNVKHF